MKAFLKFQSNLNTSYTKLKGTPIKIALATPKNGLSTLQPPSNLKIWTFGIGTLATFEPP
jgi:hypothetical protein